MSRLKTKIMWHTNDQENINLEGKRQTPIQILKL